MNNIKYELDLENSKYECQCKACSYQRKYFPLYGLSLIISILLPIFWAVPLIMLLIQVLDFRGIQNTNNPKDHGSNFSRVKRYLSYTIIGFFIYIVLISFLVIPIIYPLDKHASEVSNHLVKRFDPNKCYYELIDH